jgi:hypothetical protein
MHPEADRLLALEVKQHALAFRQLFAEHQAAGALRVVGRKLDGKWVDAGAGYDLKRRLPGRLGRRRPRKTGGGGERGSGDKERRRKALGGLVRRCNARGERR